MAAARSAAAPLATRLVGKTLAAAARSAAAPLATVPARRVGSRAVFSDSRSAARSGHKDIDPARESGRERRRPYATPPKGGGHKALKNILPPRKGRGYSDRSAERSGR